MYILLLYILICIVYVTLKPTPFMGNKTNPINKKKQNLLPLSGNNCLIVVDVLWNNQPPRFCRALFFTFHEEQVWYEIINKVISFKLQEAVFNKNQDATGRIWALSMSPKASYLFSQAEQQHSNNHSPVPSQGCASVQNPTEPSCPSFFFHATHHLQDKTWRRREQMRLH